MQERQDELLEKLQSLGLPLCMLNKITADYVLFGHGKLDDVVFALQMQKALKLDNIQCTRYYRLREHLKRKNLDLRHDSSLCLNHVYFGENNMHTICDRMKEAQYLHDKCDFQAGYESAKPFWNESDTKDERLGIIRRSVLDQTATKTYPFRKRIEHNFSYADEI
jgi:hypothetical protein